MHCPVRCFRKWKYHILGAQASSGHPHESFISFTSVHLSFLIVYISKPQTEMKFKNPFHKSKKSEEINVPIELTSLCKYSWYSVLYFLNKSFFSSSVLGNAVSFSFFQKYIHISVSGISQYILLEHQLRKKQLGCVLEVKF